MSFGTSPTAPSLLIPSNPAFSSAESAPRGGILINVHRASESNLNFPEGSSSVGRTSDSDSPITPSFSQTLESAFPPASPNLSITNGKSLKIRFAPLPDPRRPRSLSTGRNIAWTAQVGEDGEERRALAIKDHNADEYAIEDEEDDEEDDEDGIEGEDGPGGHKRGRSWSKTMGSSWKGTKKLLSGKNPVSTKEKEKEKDDQSGYGAGAPLKKSVSTGGFIGSSPFRWTTEIERKLSMQGTSPPTVTSLLSAHRPSASTSSTSPTTSGHRRNSSLEPTTPNRAHRNSSPGMTPIRLMNGRVYGSRRASEAAEREKMRREKSEPAFVEWGQGAVASSAAEESGGRSFLGDNDDGGGMAWVKRRREERLRKEQEEREKKEQEQGQGQGENVADRGSGSDESPTTRSSANRRGDGDGLSSSTSSTSSLDIGNNVGTRHGISNPKTPAIPTSDLPPAPIIRVSDGEAALTIHTNAPSAATADLGSNIQDDLLGPKGERMSPSPTPPGTGTGTGMATPIPVGKEKEEHGHVVRAMRIPTEAESKAQAKGKAVDVFGEVDTHSRSSHRQQGSYDDDDEDDDDEDEDDEGDEDEDGDYEDDEDEELDAIRTTSSAAGVEVVSRHK
ncbi:hypothetical protein IAU59_004129 [Kwoniella sp. CBS 9459]